MSLFRAGSLAGIAQRARARPFVARWNRTRAHVTVGVLVAGTLGALLTRQSRGLPLLLVASAAFVLLVVMEVLAPVLDRRVVLWVSAGLVLAAVLAPPRDSQDVWSYAMYGHMVTHYHASPYAASPMAYSGDPWFWRVSVWWQDTKTVYGPVFTGLSAAGMLGAGGSALAARLFFQLLTGAAVLGAVVLLYRRGAEAGALAFLGLSPVMTVNVVNGAHNDALVGIAALAAVLALSRGRPTRSAGAVLAGVLLGLGALVKLVAVLPAAALVAWLWRREGVRRALGVAGIVAGIVVVGYLLVGGLPALGPVQDASRLVDHWSLWGWFGHKVPPSPVAQGQLGGLLIPPAPKLWLTGNARYAGSALVAVVAAVAGLAGSADSRPSSGMAATALGFVLATSYIQPWYLAALLPLLALQWRSRLAALGLAYSVLLLLSDAWTNSTGVLKTVLRVPLSTAFPVFQLVALVALIGLAVAQVRRAGLPPLRPALARPPETLTAA
ncbi:MAG TPA: hypothetical protein VFW71_15525 [Actinomycetota bacterium]|nr:hypothetical protein [Actinomycetota bacterium]